MYTRLISPPKQKSFFLFGPRGVGKTAWIKANFPESHYFDLLSGDVYSELLASPSRLEDLIPRKFSGWVALDEIQRIPELLNEVHRLIESRKLKFILTGSSARKLRRRGVNLLAGRAITKYLYPLTAAELGTDFELKKALRYGCLPSVYREEDPKAYLQSYVSTYLREEVLQEGLTRNLGAFARFLQSASLSQAAPLNMASVGRECGISPKVAEDYFQILEDLLIAVRLPVFTRKAKRRMTVHPKFFYFDSGIFQAIRPRGPLDSVDEIEGPALETLFLQQARAINEYGNLGYTFFFWRTASKAEIDLIAYGEHGLLAFEVKRTSRVRRKDLTALLAFQEDYPQASVYLFYLGNRRYHDKGIEIIPYADALLELERLLATSRNVAKAS